MHFEKSAPVVLKIVFITTVCFLLQQIFAGSSFIDDLVLVPSEVFPGWKVWQLGSYIFLHGDLMHLILNMYALYMFGLTLEQVWGKRLFLTYYLFCGIGAGVTVFVVSYITGDIYVGTVGASGAIFGLLFAFGILFPDVTILFMFIIPLKAKYFTLVIGGLSLYMQLTGSMPGISHLGHLGGLLFGIIFFMLFLRNRKQNISRFSKNIAKSRKKHEESSSLDLNYERKKIIIQNLEANPRGDHLSDDDYQYIKYLDIMYDQDNIKESNIKVNIDEMSDQEFIQQVRKYLEVE